MNLTLAEKERIQGLIEEGVTRSADRLGKLSRTQWGVMSSSTNEIPVVRLLSWFSRSSDEHLAAALSAVQDIPTQAVMVFSVKGAAALSEAVTRPWAERMKALPDLVELTIGEISNILAQSVIGALADQFGRTVILSVPQVRRGPKAEIVAAALEGYDGRKDVLLMSHVELYSNDLAADCSMVLAVDSEALRMLVRAQPV
ncbi:MAG: hypothetical protein HYZ75_03995 [Elusimicrobia bacterium]|nr:hypothetical protein [Elusimicrobiota bacterium]